MNRLEMFPFEPFGMGPHMESATVIELLKVLVRPDDTPKKVEENVNLVFGYLKAIEEIEKQREAVRTEERKRQSRIEGLKQGVRNLRYEIRDDEDRLKNTLTRIETAKAEDAKKKKRGQKEIKLPYPECKDCGCGREYSGRCGESVEQLNEKAKGIRETTEKRKQNLAKAVAELEKLGEKVGEEKRQDDPFNG